MTPSHNAIIATHHRHVSDHHVITSSRKTSRNTITQHHHAPRAPPMFGSGVQRFHDVHGTPLPYAA
jgi:hypothetical protein